MPISIEQKGRDKAMRKNPIFKLAAQILPHLIPIRSRDPETTSISDHRTTVCTEALSWAMALESTYETLLL